MIKIATFLETYTVGANTEREVTITAQDIRIPETAKILYINSDINNENTSIFQTSCSQWVSEMGVKLRIINSYVATSNIPVIVTVFYV